MRYDADGERWDVYLSEEAPRGGMRAVIFHCASNSSYGWRVVEVPADRYASDEAFEEAAEEELNALYTRSQPFDYAHDPKAREDHIGEGEGRP
jgi:hypothetical protein